MGYDSIKKRVGDYSKSKIENDEEDMILSRDEMQLDSVSQSVFSLDSDLQDKINSVRKEYESERARIDGKKVELDAEREVLSSTITSEVGKLSEADSKLKKVGTMKYGKAADTAKKKCEEYITQLEGLLDELGGEHSADIGCDIQSGPIVNDSFVDNSDSIQIKTDNQYASASNPVYGNGEFTPLLMTAQTIQTVFLAGKEVDVFDHPFEPNDYRICNQGSAYPTGPQDTCGCCSCGTIINKSGGKTNEHEIVAYAWNNRLCSDSGGTSPSSWVNILGGAGINSHDTSGISLPELADYVEQGHGVIIGVSACTYNPQMYGHYFPGVADGHALVLESVVRDHKTGEILEYVVSDSNGKSRDDACHRVSANVLEKAFSRKHKASVVTNDVIW